MENSWKWFKIFIPLGSSMGVGRLISIFYLDIRVNIFGKWWEYWCTAMRTFTSERIASSVCVTLSMCAFVWNGHKDTNIERTISDYIELRSRWYRSIEFALARRYICCSPAPTPNCAGIDDFTIEALARMLFLVAIGPHTPEFSCGTALHVTRKLWRATVRTTEHIRDKPKLYYISNDILKRIIHRFLEPVPSDSPYKWANNFYSYILLNFFANSPK